MPNFRVVDKYECCLQEFFGDGITLNRKTAIDMR